MTQLKTRTYQGSTIDEVLPKIREELGDDAIVVRQREGLKGGVGGFFQKRCVEVEARPGETPADLSPPTRGFSVTDGPDVAPPGAPQWLVDEPFLDAPDPIEDGSEEESGYVKNILLTTRFLEASGIRFDVQFGARGGEDALLLGLPRVDVPLFRT